MISLHRNGLESHQKPTPLKMNERKQPRNTRKKIEVGSVQGD